MAGDARLVRVAEHRFYAGTGLPSVLDPAGDLVLTGEAAHRIVHVLHLRRGERLAIFGDGREFDCELTETGSRVSVRLLEELAPEPARCTLTLYPALIRPNRFEWMIEKVTELGVAAIVPLLSERTAVRPAEIGASRLERWRRIAIEAAEQSGRRAIPSIEQPAAYASALKAAEGLRVFTWEGLRVTAAPATMEMRSGATDRLSLFIGPEGGWSDGEVEAAQTAGARLLGLGPNVLRAETAAIAAVTLLLLT